MTMFAPLPVHTVNDSNTPVDTTVYFTILTIFNIYMYIYIYERYNFAKRHITDNDKLRVLYLILRSLVLTEINAIVY